MTQGRVRGTEGRNLKQVAALLGVHYTTVYRYVRTGRLPARRAGAGWLVEEADLVAFAAREDPTGPTRRVPRSRDPTDRDQRGRDPRDQDPAAGSGQPWRARLVAPLSAGDETSAWRILEQALAAGHGPDRCYLEVLVGALDDVSDRSRRPDAPRAEEYLATATAARLVARLGARFRRPGRSRGTVVFGAVAGEHHTLAIAVAADLVRLEGFHCLELGADVPAEAFAGAAAGAHRLVAVGIGVTRTDHLEAVGRTVRAVRALDAAIPVVVGGQAADAASVSATGADAWVTDGRAAVRCFVEMARTRRRLWALDDGRVAG